MLGNFSCADFFQKLHFSKNSFRKTIRVSNGLDQDQNRCSFSPDLGPNGYQQTTKITTSKERVNTECNLFMF